MNVGAPSHRPGTAPTRRLAVAVCACVLLLVPACASTGGGGTGEAAPAPVWYDPQDWGVQGQGWEDTDLPYDRLPARARGVVRDGVWNRSRQPAGLSVFFETDSPTIHVNYRLGSGRLALPHVPATAVSGVDLYAEGDDGRWRWVAVSKPRSLVVSQQLAGELAPGLRRYRLYLPLYNPVRALRIGVRQGTTFRPDAPAEALPIVIYGTSITQGSCSSRPGMSYAAQLGRLVKRPVINLGFAGEGEMEPELGQLMTELDACAYVIDCLPNLDAGGVAERTEPLVRLLRADRPDVPIVLMEDRTLADAHVVPRKRSDQRAKRDALRDAYERLRAEGVTGLHYVTGEALIGDDDEGTTDGVHPNDLGMTRYAAVLAPVLQRAIDGEPPVEPAGRELAAGRQAGLRHWECGPVTRRDGAIMCR